MNSSEMQGVSETLSQIPVERIYELPTDLSYLGTLVSLAVGGIATRAMEYIEAVLRKLTLGSGTRPAGESYWKWVLFSEKWREYHALA